MASHIVLIDDVPALVASLPQQYGREIPPRSLVLLLLKTVTPQHMTVENIAVSPLESLDRFTTTELTSGTVGNTVIAVIVDDLAHCPAVRGYEHSLILDAAAYGLAARDATMTALYATSAISAGHPVWSVDTYEILGSVPAPRPAPPGGTSYHLAQQLSWPAINPPARLADTVDDYT
ncbi:hypothetical protein AB0L82_35990 [Nocardia sp. NPDC052001]|uniref:hypothetical protein n=1 Tax=Nocardia sp. NPDC052001 TaxID=3154853 RepID=UPI003447E9FA